MTEPAGRERSFVTTTFDTISQFSRMLKNLDRRLEDFIGVRDWSEPSEW